MRNDVQEVVLSLRRDLVCEALDVISKQAAWAIHHFQNGHDAHAIASFERIITCIKAAAPEARQIQASLAAKQEIGDAAAEFREHRGAAA